MKATVFFLSFTIISQISLSQIISTKVAEEKITFIEPYDSTQNFLGKKYKQYVGQEFYLVPQSESLRKYGYEGFVLDYNKSEYDKANKFKCCEGDNSNYEELQGKYFSVIEVIEDSKSSYSGSAYLKLKMKETNEIVYYKYNSKYSHSFPFLVLGYYEKQKKVFKGNEVLIRPFPKIEGANQKKTLDINTGEEIEFVKGKFVKCIDLTIDEKYYELALLLENDNGQQFLFAMHTRDLNIRRILTKEEAEEYRKQYGDDNWNTILDERIKVGFTEEMTLVSWGKPEKINRASYGDQWIYKNQNLYFENGKLISFTNFWN